MIDFAALQPRRHAPPPGWPAEAFEVMTDALAAALIAAIRRTRETPANLPTGSRSAAPARAERGAG